MARRRRYSREELNEALYDSLVWAAGGGNCRVVKKTEIEQWYDNEPNKWDRVKEWVDALYDKEAEGRDVAVPVRPSFLDPEDHAPQLDLSQVMNQMQQMIRSEVAKETERFRPREVHVHIQDGVKEKVKKLKGTMHELFHKLLHVISTRTRHGSRRNAYLYGDSQSGKTTAAELVAEALGIPYYYISLAPTDVASKIIHVHGVSSSGGRPQHLPPGTVTVAVPVPSASADLRPGPESGTAPRISPRNPHAARPRPPLRGTWEGVSRSRAGSGTSDGGSAGVSLEPAEKGGNNDERCPVRA